MCISNLFSEKPLFLKIFIFFWKLTWNQPAVGKTNFGYSDKNMTFYSAGIF